MSDPAQQCPTSWQIVEFQQPIPSCGKKTATSCDSLAIATSGARYQKVCGRFKGYQVTSPDGFWWRFQTDLNVEMNYVDGISITYGSPGSRHHVFTYAAGYTSNISSPAACPCAGGASPPSFVGSDYYCESGSTGFPTLDMGPYYYSSDVLWDGQQCTGSEVTCCSPPNLPWFCKTFPTPIAEDMEVRICMDEEFENENVALEFFELYILRKSKLCTCMRGGAYAHVRLVMC